MDVAHVVARMVLAGVFVVAGTSKLRDRQGSYEALADFGVPDKLAHAFAVVLPILECVVGLALLSNVTVRLASIGALSLLTLFVIGIAVNLAKGRRPSCHCFGQLYSAPIGWSTVTRNVLLAGMAAFVLSYKSRGGAAVTAGMIMTGDRMDAITIALLLCGLAAGLTLVLVIHLIRQHGRILLRLEAIETGVPASPSELADTGHAGLPIGSTAPHFHLNRLGGGESSLDFWLALNKPLLLFFTNPHCGPCRSLLPDISRWHTERSSDVSMVLITEGTAADNLAKNIDGSGVPVLLQRNREVADVYQAAGTPAVVLVLPDGRIGSPVVMGAEAVRDATLRALQSHRRDRVDDMSSIELRDTGGNVVSITALARAQPAVLLFWNPDCGFCQRMYPELRSWDAQQPPDAPRLIVISTGTADQNRAMQLKSVVLSDPESRLSAALEAHGTPMAVLLDADGHVASPIAAGRDAVLELFTPQAVY